MQIELNDNDKKRASEIAAYPWFKDHKGWQKEIAKHAVATASRWKSNR